jgi:hypothetical protein
MMDRATDLENDNMVFVEAEATSKAIFNGANLTLEIEIT